MSNLPDKTAMLNRQAHQSSLKNTQGRAAQMIELRGAHLRQNLTIGGAAGSSQRLVSIKAFRGGSHAKRRAFDDIGLICSSAKLMTIPGHGLPHTTMCGVPD
jgi:hypothetical protein